MILAGFADEALTSFGGQLAMLTRLGVRHLDLRRIGATGVLAASEKQLRHAEAALAEAGVRVSCLASGVGKVPVDASLHRELDRLLRACALAHRFGTPYVRVFSFRTTTPDADRAVVLGRLDAFAEVAEREGITLLHENEKGVWGDSPGRCAEVAALAPGRLKLILDPANYVQCGWRPFDDAWPLVGPHTEYVHVKDAVRATGRVVPAGAGSGQWPHLLGALRDAGYAGFLSLEPHLGLGGRGGPVTPRGWSVAAGALLELLRQADIEPTG